MALSLDTTARLEEALSHTQIRVGAFAQSAPSRPTGWAELDALLPDGGLPHGVVELACHSTPARAAAFAGATGIAVRAIANAHANDARSLAAWLDSTQSLHAPGLLQNGIDVERLLVVRPEPALLGRVAVKLVGSGAFDVIVVDLDGDHLPNRGREAPELVVRKLALAAESSGATVMLLTEPARSPKRIVPWPVAMRLDVARHEDSLSLSIPKERRGRIRTSPIELRIGA